MYIKTRKKRETVKARAFTLVELLVVTGILTVLTTIVLANHSVFGGAITLQNLAYDIALSVREAQTYGISVSQFNSQFSAGYGMHFRASSPTSFILFSDVVQSSGKGHYDGSDELARLTDIGRGYRIADLCVVPPTAAIETCGISIINILFERPEPDAQIRSNGLSDLNQRARIVVEAPQGDQASIIIEATGQISVQ